MLLTFYKINFPVLLLRVRSILLALYLFLWLSNSTIIIFSDLFPIIGRARFISLSWFMVLAILNLLSLIVYNYPVTTTLGFNLSLAISLWLSRILMQVRKIRTVSSLLPSNTPWYLIPFLRLVELVRILVRPITLCFRLLANIRAGHILLTLICKIPLNLWVLGVLFGLLELIVSLVQAFVFLILVGVYLEESFSH